LPRESDEVFMKRYLERLSSLKVTAILFGSTVRGERTAISDYDILIVKEDECIDASPAKLEPRLNASVFEVLEGDLERLAYTNSVVVAALLEGTVILDNLEIQEKLENLREKIVRCGARVTKDYVKFPSDS